MTKRIYEIPELDLIRVIDADVITASGNDDIANDLWPSGVSPQLTD